MMVQHRGQKKKIIFTSHCKELGIELLPEMFDEINHKLGAAYRKHEARRQPPDGGILVCCGEFRR